MCHPAGRRRFIIKGPLFLLTVRISTLLGARLWIRGVGSNPLLRRNLFIHLSFCLLQQMQKCPRRMFRPCWRSRLRPLLRQCRRAATAHHVPLLGAMLWIRGVGRNPLFPRIQFVHVKIYLVQMQGPRRVFRLRWRWRLHPLLRHSCAASSLRLGLVAVPRASPDRRVRRALNRRRPLVSFV